MEKILDVLAFIGLFLWQLPQNLIALFMLLYFKFRGDLSLVEYKDYCYAFKSNFMSGGISLGNFIFLSKYLEKKPTYIEHEYGHVWWSHVFGPLYLLIVGLPSILNAAFDFTDCYYDFYTEKWANDKANLGVDKNCRLYFKDR